MPGTDGRSGPLPGLSSNDVMSDDWSWDSISFDAWMTSFVGFDSDGTEGVRATSEGIGFVPEG